LFTGPLDSHPLEDDCKILKVLGCHSGLQWFVSWFSELPNLSDLAAHEPLLRLKGGQNSP
jgi:hypothetical protein